MSSDILTEYQKARDFFEDIGLKEEFEEFIETSVKPIAFLEYAKIKKWLVTNNISVSEEGYTFEVFFESSKQFIYIIEKEKLKSIILISNFTLIETLKKCYVSMCNKQFNIAILPLFEGYRILLEKSALEGKDLLDAHIETVQKISGINVL